MWVQFFLYCCSSLKFEHSLDLKEIYIEGDACPLYQSEYRDSGLYTEYTRVEINGITELKNATFTNSKALTEIKLCSSLYIIESSCFAACQNLLSIQIPNGVLALNAETFLQCTNLQNITLPSTIISISVENTFHKCPNLQHIYVSPENKIFSTLLDDTILVENNVSAVLITSLYSTVNLPSQIQNLGKLCLGGSFKVTKINFSDNSNLKSVTDGAFIQSGLADVRFPEGVQSLGSGIFTETYVKTVHLPKSLISVSPSVFAGMYSLDTVSVASGCTGVFVQEESGVILNKEKNQIIFIPKSTESFTILTTIGSLDPTTIKKNQKLKTLNTEFGHEIYYAYKNTLYQDSNHTLLANAGGNTEVTVFAECTTISYGAFEGTLVKTVRFESNKCKAIKNSAFINCGSLTTVVLPESMEEIWQWVFQWTGLTSINFPASLKMIGNNAFFGCPITSVNLSSCILLESFGSSSFGKSTMISSVSLPPKLKSISNKLFFKCVNLRTILIPETVTSIGVEAFHQSGLTKVEFNGTQLCNLNRLEDMCFMSTQLTLINIPDSVTYIGKQVFKDCASLKSIIFGEASRLETIKEGMIENSNLIESIYLGKFVSEIAPTALSQSYGLTTVNISESNPVFDHSEDHSSIYAPQTHEFVFCAGGIKRIEIDGSIKKIRQNAFYMCRNLLEVKFGAQSDLDSIGKATFYGCSNISDIVLPSKLKEILDSAFSNCTVLKNVSFRPNAIIQSIGSSSFAGCVSLANIEFPQSLNSIGTGAFQHCRSLRTIKLSANISEIASNAFSDCSGLYRASICISSAPTGFAIDAFERVSRDFAFDVSKFFNTNSPEPTLCNRPIRRILDKDCMVPTAAFTAAAEIDNTCVLSFATAVLYSAETE